MNIAKQITVFLVLAGMLGSCYLPASRNWYNYAGSFCGRKSLTDRACSAGFFLITSPVYVGALIVDLPFSMIEFFVGWTPFKDPLMALQDLEQLPKMELDDQGHLWTLDVHPENSQSLLLTRTFDGVILDAYTASRVDGYELRVAQAYCDDDRKANTCY